MRVCMILEGCYPYTRGGVSSWVNDYIKSSPNTEYVLWVIHANRKDTKKMMYELPKNIVEFKQVYLEDAFKESKRTQKSVEKDCGEVVKALSVFLYGGDYSNLFEICRGSLCSSVKLAHSRELLDLAAALSEKEKNLGLSEAFYGLRSVLLPIFHIINQEIPEADVYHSAVAGYGGIMAATAKCVTGKPFILSEHGLYPREREEELLISDWLSDDMRDIWINFFYNLSKCAYYFADKVTALFEDAMKRQIALGCEEEKCRFIHNGIYCENFSSIPIRENDGYVNIGAFIRFAQIKDIKTLLYAFNNLKYQNDKVRLYICGGTDDEEYKRECFEIIDEFKINDVYVLGFVNTIEYMKQFDFTVMTSISEGQPLAILESLASARPCVVTNVGSCRELVLGDSGSELAGICCSPMDISEIAEAMELLSSNIELRKRYGLAGRNRVVKEYTHKKMMDNYFEVYKEVL